MILSRERRISLENFIKKNGGRKESSRPVHEEVEEVVEPSTQAQRRPLRSRLGVLAVGTALLAAVGVTFAPPVLEHFSRANAEESKPTTIDLKGIMQIDNKVWEPMTDFPNWQRTLIPSLDSKSKAPWELILFYSPADDLKIESSFPYIARSSLMKNESPLNTEHGTLILFDFKVSEDASEPPIAKNPLITDGGIIIYNEADVEEEKKSIYYSVEEDQLQLHYLINSRNMSMAALKVSVAKVQSGNIVGAIGINKEGTAVQPINSDSQVLDEIQLPEPFYPKGKPKKLSIIGFARKGFITEVNTAMAARPLP